MAGNKRKKSAITISQGASKRVLRSRHTPEREVILLDSESEDDLDAIRKQVEDEQRLAKPQSASRLDDLIVIDDSDTESDEAMAQRLSKEWATADGVSVTGEGASTTIWTDVQARPSTKFRWNNALAKSLEPQSHTSYSIAHEGQSPSDLLSGFRGMFTVSRECSNCHKEVKSPRGHVSNYVPFFDVFPNERSIPDAV